MISRSVIFAVILCLAWGMFSLPAAAVTIRGKVVETDSSGVKIEYHGEHTPNVGDPVKIGFKIGEEFAPVEGEWKIVKVGPEFVWAKAGSTEAGTPGMDYLAVIQSEKPQKKTSFTSKKDTSEKAFKDEAVVDKDAKSAADLYREGLQHYNGDGVPQDNEKAFELFEQAAKMGHASAQLKLGWMYYRGEGVNKDPVQSVKWYRKSADQNNVTAKNNLGDMYLDGNGVVQDYAKAKKLFHEAAEGGELYAFWNLGKVYNYGLGVDKNLTTAFSYYLQAAEMGHTSAQDKVCQFYMNGSGVTKNYKKASTWCRKAADAGKAKASNNLGLLYLKGWGMVRDYSKAHHYFEKAADRGYKWGYFNLGRLFDNGWGVPQNEKKALEHYYQYGDYIKAYKEGARDGNKEAQRWLKKRNMDW
jgi:TPR repeat protein